MAGCIHLSNSLVYPSEDGHPCQSLQPGDLGVYIDAGVTMKTQVINTVRACFAAHRQIRSVRRSLPQHALRTLIRTLVITKLDQCNSVLVGTSVLCIPAGPTAVRAECRRSACLLAPDVRTHHHYYGSFTGYASRNESSSGCVFWRTIVCMAQHRRTCLTACGRHRLSASPLC